MRLYIDEDAMAKALVAGLVERGFDVETAELAGMRGVADAAHLRYAASVGRTLYSFNRGDYLSLHWEWLGTDRHHAGILVLGRRKDVGSQLRALVQAAEERGQTGMADFLKVI